MKTEKNIKCQQCKGSCQSIFKDQFQPDYLPARRMLQVYKKGETIFHQGTIATGLYCLGEGMVKLVTTESDGKEFIQRFAGPGDLIGHSSISEKRLHRNSAVAVEETTCCFFETAEFLSLLKQDPALNFPIYSKLENEIREAQQKNIFHVTMNVREKVAAFFDYMGKHYGQDSDQGRRIDLRLSREEMASFIGTAHETLIRFITEFKQLGLIQEEKKYFYILDEEKLLALVKKAPKENSP